MPRTDAAYASAAAWLPELCVTTPRRASASSSASTALTAPRALKAPHFCRFSHFMNTRAASSRSSVAEVTTGVRCTCPRMRAAAARRSSMPTAGRGGVTAAALLLAHSQPPVLALHVVELVAERHADEFEVGLVGQDLVVLHLAVADREPARDAEDVVEQERVQVDVHAAVARTEPRVRVVVLERVGLVVTLGLAGEHRDRLLQQLACELLRLLVAALGPVRQQIGRASCR